MCSGASSVILCLTDFEFYPCGEKIKNIGWTRSTAVCRVPILILSIISDTAQLSGGPRICQQPDRLLFERCRTQKDKTLISISRCVEKNELFLFYVDGENLYLGEIIAGSNQKRIKQIYSHIDILITVS